MPLAAQTATALAGPETLLPQLENEFFTIAFDLRLGRWNARRKNGAPLLSGAAARATTGEARRGTAEAAYQHQIETTRFEDRLGAGRQLVVRSADGERQLDFELRVALYPGREAVFVEALCRNASSRPVTLRSIEPLCVLPEEEGAIHWPGVTKILTNGPMYYDPGKVLEFSLPAKATRSWWNIGFFSGYDREGLVCGYVQNTTALGQVMARPAPEGKIGLTAESVLAREFLLQPGQRVSSNRFMINLAPDPYTALETYAQVMGTLGQARVHSILNGWCDWPYAFGDITEEEMLRNAEFAARVLKPFGLQYIQVDEGFQRWHGDWEGNERFPHGMKWLAGRIRSLGLKPGLWLAPYVISEPTEVFQKHPEWLLRHLDGRLRRVGPWPSEDSDWARQETPKRYGLDITHPGAAKWLYNLFDTVAHEWGYDLVKIDFVDWSLLAAERYQDPSVSRAAAYRKGVEIMRQALGPDRHLLDCGPGPVSVGLLDSMRIELDQPPVNWKQYFLESASSAPGMAKRYYFHKRAWINDADHLCLGSLTVSQAQAAATLLALSGGNLISGDRLPDLDPVRLEILKKVLPSAGEAARPVDLFDTDRHSVFALRIQRPFGEWTVVGMFNASETEAIERTLPLGRLWLDPKKTYLAYDFWKERFYGEVTGELRVSVAPASVVLLALHEKKNVPQVLSTDRHALQGALELEQVAWDPAAKTLEGVSLGPAGTAHNVTVYVPEAHPWFQGGPFLFHDFPGYTLKMMDTHILRVRVRFDQVTRVPWKIDMAKFFTQ